MIAAKLFQKYASDPAAFRDDLLIDVDGVIRGFGSVMNAWQRDDFAALDPALQRCNGRKPDATGPSRAYLERGRGHSKTTDLAVMTVWALAFAARPVRGYAFAADKDQARLLRDAVQTIVRLNPWLSDVLTVETHRIVNTAAKHPGEGGTLTIEASDVGSSFGILPDFIIADELVHWQGDGSLWHSIISSAAKRSTCVLVVISNAGMAETWQWPVREAARTDEAWHFSRLDGPVASWLTKERLDEQRRMLPAVSYERLWGNNWSSGLGDAVSEADINAAFKPDLVPMLRKEPGWLYTAGIDLGLTRDCSAVVILATPDDGKAGRIRLARTKLWRPVGGKKIDLTAVERYVLAMDELYELQFVGFDPWQMESMGQRLEANSDHRRRNQRRIFNSQPWMREIPPTTANLRAQATLVIESFNDGRLQFFDCPPLRADLRKLRVEEKSYGFRLVSPRDAQGHGDTFSAFSLSLLMAHEVSGKKVFVAGQGWDSDDPDPMNNPYSPYAGIPRAGQPGSTAYDMAQEDFALEQREYAEEMRLLSQPDDSQEPFRALMRRFGRL